MRMKKMKMTICYLKIKGARAMTKTIMMIMRLRKMNRAVMMIDKNDN